MKKIGKKFWSILGGGHVTTFCPISGVWKGNSKIASTNPSRISQHTFMAILGSFGPSVGAVGGGLAIIALPHFLICVHLYSVVSAMTSRSPTHERRLNLRTRPPPPPTHNWRARVVKVKVGGFCWSRGYLMLSVGELGWLKCW